MASLLNTAQGILDLYNQDFAGPDDFIDISNVAPLAYSEFRRLARQEFREERILNRTLDGFATVDVDPEFLIREEVELTRDGDLYVATLSSRAMSFGWDTMTSSIQRVRNIGGDCNKELVRIAPSDDWQMCLMPETDKVFYYPETVSESQHCPALSRLVFLGKCRPKKVRVDYVPSYEGEIGDVPISDDKVKAITDSVLQTLLIAKQQRVIDKTNDGNANGTVATEANPDHVKPKP